MSWNWNLPPGCRTLPGEEEPPPQYKCSECGAFLPWEPNEEVKDQPVYSEWDPKTETEKVVLGDLSAWRCKRCGEIGRLDY